MQKILFKRYAPKFFSTHWSNDVDRDGCVLSTILFFLFLSLNLLHTLSMNWKTTLFSHGYTCIWSTYTMYYTYIQLYRDREMDFMFSLAFGAHIEHFHIHYHAYVCAAVSGRVSANESWNEKMWVRECVCVRASERSFIQFPFRKHWTSELTH